MNTVTKLLVLTIALLLSGCASRDETFHSAGRVNAVILSFQDIEGESCRIYNEQASLIEKTPCGRILEVLAKAKDSDTRPFVNLLCGVAGLRYGLVAISGSSVGVSCQEITVRRGFQGWGYGSNYEYSYGNPYLRSNPFSVPTGGDSYSYGGRVNLGALAPPWER